MMDHPDPVSGPHLPDDSPTLPEGGTSASVETAAAESSTVQGEVSEEAAGEAATTGAPVMAPVLLAAGIGFVAFLIVSLALVLTTTGGEEDTASASDAESVGSTTTTESADETDSSPGAATTTTPPTTAPPAAVAPAPTTAPQTPAPPPEAPASNQWPQVAVATFTEGCSSQGIDDAQCQCVLNELQVLFTWEEYQQFANLDPNGPPPAELQPVIEKCLLGRP